MTAMLIGTAVVLSGVCLLGWGWQCRTRNAGHADVIWIFGLGGTALVYLLGGDGHWMARLIAGALVLTWSLRLGVHVARRVLSEPDEDGRYQAMREAMGRRINLFHFFFFQGQGLLAWLFALPFAAIGANTGPAATVWLIAGAGVGVLALTGEALADRQLAQWRADPMNRGYTCRQGLWRYSRHPNYFFEWLHWFSYPLLAAGSPWQAWLWLAPVLMLLFLWFVTGIPYTERQALKTRGEDYREYQRTTSAFIPWRPKC
jgi:steroid 5-alpha reductase family enzyme